MKKNLMTAGIIAGIIAAIIVLNRYQPQRLAEAHYEAELKANEALLENQEKPPSAEEAVKELAANYLKEQAELYAAKEGVDTAPLDAKDYQVTLECSNGTIILEVRGELAPLGAKQFRTAIGNGVYDGARFFRVIPGFMAQFGIPGDPKKAALWERTKIKDDPVKASNVRGTVSFAMAGPDTRTTQLFINYGDNSRLDGMGFSPFARVVKGMDIADSIFSGHRERPNQGAIQEKGNEYLQDNFPELDYIKRATIQPLPVASVEDEGTDDADDTEPESTEAADPADG